MALVSVIIPVHDAGRFLDSCLRSVRSQTHHDLQVICVDDGSSDQSPGVLEQHAATDSRIELVRQSNLGPGSARNAGSSQAVGEYLMFVDADDVVPADAIERHLNSLASSTADFSTGRVIRVAGSHRWPSAMHDRALARPATASHVFRDPGLVSDTTSWNKLFRSSFWLTHRYRFPDDVLFEDVALMTEAHCRATSVEVLGGVVYHWRRRDDGTLSITMRRDDPTLLRDRIGSLLEVRRLLSELAPPVVRRAAELKFLRYDLGSYFDELEWASAAFQREFVRRVGEFLDGRSDSVLRDLPTPLRIGYELVRRGDPQALVDFFGYLRDNDGKLPVRRRGLALRADPGPAARSVPRSFASVARRLPVKASVERAAWQGNSLVIEGYGFIDGVGFGHPGAAIRRLRLLDPDRGVERHVWVAPMRLPATGARIRMAPSYEWAGFKVRVPSALLTPRAGDEAAHWQVSLQVLAMGAASGSALGPPAPGAEFAEVHRDVAGISFRAHWVDGKRLVIDSVRAGLGQDVTEDRLSVRALAWHGDHLTVSGVLPRPDLSRPDRALPVFTWSNGVGDLIEARSRCSPGGFEVTFDLARLAARDGSRRLPAGRWTLLSHQPDGSFGVVSAAGNLPMSTERHLAQQRRSIRIGVDHRRSLTMWVHDLAAGERDALGQRRLVSGVYAGAIRRPIEDLVLVESWGGRSYSDNPRALAEQLVPGAQTAAVVVVVADRSVRVPDGMVSVVAGSREHHQHRARAQLIIANDCMPQHYVKREGQKYLQTWHGTPLKRIGLDIERIRFRGATYRRDLRADSAKWDWLISQNAHSSAVFRSAFAYEGTIIESGYPRNDLLAGSDDQERRRRRDRVRRWLGIGPEQTAVLWAPTWRDDTYTSGGYGASMVLDPADLDAVLPPETILLFRGHHRMSPVPGYLSRERLRNVSSYAEVEELILASDALITDYSSIMFDYAITDRPTIHFVPDRGHYERIRGLYLDLASIAAGPLLSEVSELAEALRSLAAIRSEFTPARAALRRRFCALDDGNAAQRIWSHVGR